MAAPKPTLLLLSATDLVSSSMNSGTPSVLATNCATMAAGRSSGATPRIIASVSRRLSLASGKVTICDEFDHGARNSGRAVSRTKSRWDAMSVSI